MTAAAIKRGSAVKRKPIRVIKKSKRPSLLSRLLAAVPVSARTVEQLITVAIVATIIGGIAAVALMLDVPRRIGLTLGEAVGRAGFTVKHLDVTGIEHMDRMSVYAVALEQRSIAMPFVDLAGVRAKLLNYGWVADARVSRRLPDTLVIDIVERKPAAVWQHAQQLTLVDAHGTPLEPVKLDAMPNLPLVVGPDANQQTGQLSALLANAPQLRPVLDSASWVGSRRWDLRFQSGETLMLPEGEMAAAAALRIFAERDAAQRLLGNGVVHFDMRDPAQLVIAPGPKRGTATMTGKPTDPNLAT